MLLIFQNSSGPPPKEKVNDKDDEEIYDVWDESWVTKTTVDQCIKTSRTAGFSAYSLQKRGNGRVN